MAHINYFRNIHHIPRQSIREAIPQGYFNTSFAAFGGTKNQRDLVGLYQISRVIGHKGIVLIHNDPDFASRLGYVYEIDPSIQRRTNVPTMYLANTNGSQNSFYDPFYGLSASNILDAIAPLPSDGRMPADVSLVRSILADYLEIMNFQYQNHKTVFGQYPYNLDLLYELTKMSFSELNRTVLSFLPRNRFDNLASRLSSAESQQKAFNAVRSFALSLNTCLWTRKGFSNHSKLSIISSVATRNLISIYVPGSRKEILDYLAIEFKALNDTNTPFLLVVSGISVNESSEFKKLFLNNHIALPYSTGILSDDLTGIVPASDGRNGQNFSNNVELSALFSQTQELFVFSCSSTLSATPFSESIGTYYRQVIEQHNEVHREPFRIFSSHGRGQAQREVQQAIINPEELTNLGDGCLIYGSNHPVPILVDHFIL